MSTAFTGRASTIRLEPRLPEQLGAMVYCPFPDRETARAAASLLIDEKLAACANILGAIESVFEWEGERSSAHEVGVLFKTTDALKNKMITRLGDCHPYDTPAIIGWSCDAIHPATLAWLSDQTRVSEG